MAIGKEKIRKSLMRQLELKNADTDFFVSLVDDYIYFWERAREIRKDIRERGTTYEEVYNSSGDKVVRIHPGIKELEAINKQMLAVLKQLDLSTKNIASEDDAEEL